MSETIGSQRLLQTAVSKSSVHLQPHIARALGLPMDVGIQWQSPVASDRYREYRDTEVLDRLGITLATRALKDFWPARGPVWDGLARTESGQVLLVEAKAHIAELASPGTKAGDESLRFIEKTMVEVRAAIAPRSSASWTTTFYQYTNRLAFLYLLRENGIDAHLLHVLFLNARDVKGPATIDEWQGALQLMKAALGLSAHRLLPFTHEIFIDAEHVAMPRAEPLTNVSDSPRGF